MAKIKQVVPTSADYAVQSHQITRSSYSMPVMQRRLVYLAMAQVRPSDTELPEVEMTIGDIARALGLGDSGRQYEEIRSACKGVLGNVLDLDTEEGWIQFQWFSKARYIKTRDAIKMKLHDELRPYVLELQNAFSIISIADISKLQSRHALRIFELVMANQGMAGTGGNKPGCWYYDAEFAHLRHLLQIGSNEYQMTNNFRKFVIDSPVREINEAGLGIRIECDYERFRRGRRLLGVRLNCKTLKKGDPRPVNPATASENEDQAWIDANRELYETLLANHTKQGGLFGDLGAQGCAFRDLKAHPDAKKPKIISPKQRRS